MRNGRWTKSAANIGLGKAVFPQQPDWFRDNRDFGNIRQGLLARGFSAAEADLVLGGNGIVFFARVSRLKPDR